MAMPIMFIDIETTGLDCRIHEIIEIAIITQYSSGNVTKYHQRITIENWATVQPEALNINGYTEDKWKDSKPMSEVIQEIHCHFKKGLVVGYNPSFDWGFLTAAFEKYGLDIPWRVRLIDLMPMVHFHLQPLGCPGLSLDAVRKFLGWSMIDNHTAMKDTRDVFRLYFLFKNWNMMTKYWLMFKTRVKLRMM
jgi:DNA polymerase III alpha subunit (gram-positive type)